MVQKKTFQESDWRISSCFSLTTHRYVTYTSLYLSSKDFFFPISHMNTLFISVEIFQILRPIPLQFIQPMLYVLWFEHILLLTTIRIKIDNQFHLLKSPILMLASTVILLPWLYCIQKSLKKSQCTHILSNNTNAIVPHMRTLLEF